MVSSEQYRYGFNGKEDDNDFGSAQLIQDYGFRLYNPSISKFLSVDPLAPEYPWYTPYQFAGNKPIWAVDLDGLEESIATYNLEWITQSVLKPDRWSGETRDQKEAIEAYTKLGFWNLANASAGIGANLSGLTGFFFGTMAAPMAVNTSVQFGTQLLRTTLDREKLDFTTIYQAVDRIDKLDVALSGLPFGKLKDLFKAEGVVARVAFDQSGNLLSAAFDFKEGSLTHVFGGDKSLDAAFYDLVVGSLAPTLNAQASELMKGGEEAAGEYLKTVAEIIKGLSPFGKTIFKDNDFQENLGLKDNPWAMKYGIGSSNYPSWKPSNEKIKDSEEDK